MAVFDRRVEHLASACVAHADNRQLVLEANELLQNERRFTERLPRRFDVTGRAQHELTFAVISHATRFQTGRESDLPDSATQILAGIDGDELRCRDVQRLKECLLEQTVLSSLQ